MTASAWASAPLDREVVLARVVDADAATAFRAWTDPDQIVRWFGPEGLVIESHEIDIREGGHWLFDMVGADGTRFENLMRFHRIEENRLIEADHGTPDLTDPDRFAMLVTFDQQSNGKTVVTLRQIHPTADRRKAVMDFGAVEYGGQTLDKLAAHLAG